MSRRWKHALLVFAGVAAFLLLLRLDLADYFAWQGNALLRDGNASAAQRAFQQSIALGNHREELILGHATSLYRLGRFDQAQREFERALNAKAPHLLAAAHYNRANTLFRLAEQAAPQTPSAAGELWQAAVADYLAALAIDPQAVDARSNLDVARERIARLARASDGSRKKTSETSSTADADKSSNSDTPSKPEQSGHTDESGVPAKPDRHDTASSSSDTNDAQGKPRHQMSRTEAERLLNDARRRDVLYGPPSPSSVPGKSTTAGKDW